ncbi:hypothetical protein [Pseudomonas sp. EA_35y_Pfl2_R111]|uniref:hypothetical protein n=1 Tax=Pseudomonas sp. EA_35y_Pfl2_R111 TaxID=3088689 RepID=UPI0030DBB6A1
MNFINNWRQQMALAMAATSVALDLPDGQYVLTMSDGLGASATEWEYIGATVTGGSAELQRGQEGSSAQDWPEDSWIYCSITAAVLAALVAQQTAQAVQVAALTERLEILEALVPAQLIVTVGGDTDLAGYQSGAIGSVMPGMLNIPGEGVFTLQAATFDTPGEPYFGLIFSGHFPVESIVSITVEGVGTLDVADGFATNSGTGEDAVTLYSWEDVTTDWFASIGQSRSITFTFAA